MIKALIQSALTVLVLIALLMGIYVFQVWSYKKSETTLQKASLVVALTGGSNRLETAYELLKKGYATKLLISGTHPESRSEDIFSTYKTETDKTLIQCCVVLDTQPKDTQSNAQQTAQWVEDNTITDIILVTSDYHMPRSLLEFKHFLPDMDIQAYSVEPLDFDLLSEKTWQLYLFEGLKYWGAWVKYNLQNPQLTETGNEQ